MIKSDKRREGYRLRRSLLELGVEHRCSSCGVGPLWNKKALVLEVDHKNGDPCDHRLENLQFLCPNCHSQTGTYKNRTRSPRYVCEKCGGKRWKDSNSKLCRNCFVYKGPPKIMWPEQEELLERLSLTTYVALASELGISDRALRKHLERLGVDDSILRRRGRKGESIRSKALPA